MGQIATRSVAVVGLDSVGKSVLCESMTYHLEKGSHVILPTTGVRELRVVRDSVEWKVYDLPGRFELRGLWPPFLKAADAVVFVVDEADVDRLAEVRAVFRDVANLPAVRARGVPIVVALNRGSKAMAPPPGPTPASSSTLTTALTERLLGALPDGASPHIVQLNAARSEGIDQLILQLRVALGIAG